MILDSQVLADAYNCILSHYAAGRELQLVEADNVSSIRLQTGAGRVTSSSVSEPRTVPRRFALG
jgi:hypothetical protein